MNTVVQKLPLAAIGASVLALSAALPSNAADFKILSVSGVTGGVVDGNPADYLEYQFANLQGTVTYSLDAKDLNPDPYQGRFKIKDFSFTITNPNYPSFLAEIDRGHETKAFIELSSYAIIITNARTRNTSLNNPTLSDISLFFTDTVGNPNKPPTQTPSGDSFVADPTKSFLKLFQSPNAGAAKLAVTDAEVVDPAAIPEPTTMAGLGVFGLGALLKRQSKKSAK